MSEPWRSQFCELLAEGAGTKDIHHEAEGEGYAARVSASPAFLERELARVEHHQRGLLPLLEAHAGHSPRILDVGCGTGGTTVAMALSAVLAPERVVGLDADATSIRAAEVRARGYDLAPPRVSFQALAPGSALPFPDGSFDLVVCVSVLEFVGDADERARFVGELRRVGRPGGVLYLSTPNPLFRLREQHSGRLLGDFVRRDGFPWASPPWVLTDLLAGCERISLDDELVERGFRRLGLRPRALPARVGRVVASVAPWQKLLVRLPGGSAAEQMPPHRAQDVTSIWLPG